GNGRGHSGGRPRARPRTCGRRGGRGRFGGAAGENGPVAVWQGGPLELPDVDCQVRRRNRVRVPPGNRKRARRPGDRLRLSTLLETTLSVSKGRRRVDDEGFGHDARLPSYCTPTVSGLRTNSG